MVKGQLYRHKKEGYFIWLQHKDCFSVGRLWLVKSNYQTIEPRYAYISSFLIWENFTLIANNYQPK